MKKILKLILSFSFLTLSFMIMSCEEDDSIIQSESTNVTIAQYLTVTPEYSSLVAAAKLSIITDKFAKSLGLTTLGDDGNGYALKTNAILEGDSVTKKATFFSIADVLAIQNLNVTIFAPDNAAFESVVLSSFDTLDKRAALAQLLLSHVIAGKVFTTDFKVEAYKTFSTSFSELSVAVVKLPIDKRGDVKVLTAEEITEDDEKGNAPKGDFFVLNGDDNFRLNRFSVNLEAKSNGIIHRINTILNN